MTTSTPHLSSAGPASTGQPGTGGARTGPVGTGGTGGARTGPVSTGPVSTGPVSMGPGGFGYADLPGLISLMTGDAKHDRAALSTLDVLWVLYDRVLRVGPETADDDSRDRFFLSKGHGPMAFYAVLAAKGFVDPALLPDWASFGSPLGRHPDRMLVPGVEISSGSLGHGLPLATGTVLGLRAAGRRARVFVLIGDGELDEGSNHEAIAFAGRVGLEGLHVVAVDNASSSYGWPGGIETRFAGEGWSVARADGHDHDALAEALTAPHPGRPHAVIAVTGQARR